MDKLTDSELALLIAIIVELEQQTGGPIRPAQVRQALLRGHP